MATPLVMWCRQWLVTLDCQSSSTSPAPPTSRPGTMWSTTHLEEGRQVRDLVIIIIIIMVIIIIRDGELFIVLEDDTELSPLWYRAMVNMWQR